MAIRAEQHALAGLLPQDRQRPRHAVVGEAEALLHRIDVVELQRTDVPVVAAHDARTSGLFDQDLLDLPAPAGDRAAHAPRTPVAASFVAPELDPSVGTAVPDDGI